MAKRGQEQLIARLSKSLDQATAADLAAELERTGEAPAVLTLLDELQEASAKVARLVVEALPELRRRGVLGSVVPWLDLGVALAGSSGAAAMKYVKESPLVLGLIESDQARAQVLTVALELADEQANLALDFLRKAPELLAILPVADLRAWAEVGAELANRDYVLAIEFLQQSPAVASVLPLDQVRPWVAFGMKLITQNSLGKTDYVGTLEFFRTSPAILGDVEGLAVRKRVVALGSALADRDQQTAIVFLSEAPSLLRALPSEEWRTRVLQYGLLVAELDAESALAYLRRAPEILTLFGEEAGRQDKFEEWFRSGMEVLAYSPEGARAYFSLETRKALASLEQAMSGVPLRQVARSLKLFAQGLCGTDVTIKALPDHTESPEGRAAAKEPVRATVSPDGRTISLPAILRRYPAREENVRLYTVMTAHEAGHLEFGTYDLPLDRLADLTDAVCRRYGREPGRSLTTLDQLFSLYPQPGLVRDLWTVLEDARVESRLRHEYPGLRADLAALAREAVTTRSLLHGMSVREMVVDVLLLLSTEGPETVRIPEAIADLVRRIWDQCRTVLAPAATAEETIRLVDRLYVLLDEQVGGVKPVNQEEGTQPAQEQGLGAGPKASEASGQYRPVTNWAYRGAMDPELVRDRSGDEPQVQDDDAKTGLAPEPAQPEGAGAGGERAPGSGHRPGDVTGDQPVPRTMTGSGLDRVLAIEEDRREPAGSGRARGGAFLYDEWDGLLQDYRSGWCRVVERVAPEGSADFVDATLALHGPEVRLLRRYFEALRPPGLRRVHGQTDGDELDLDAMVRRFSDLAAGAEPSDRIYVRHEKRERDVAAAFLVDLSGSTSRQIESQGDRTRRVIDVEKEGLVLLSAALDAVGDQYAIFGYSGQGRRQVDFVVVKDFDEPAGGRAALRVDALTPLQQNRDGAAIRHAARRLAARAARVKLLVLISDGRPLDDRYADEYSLEDTKMALREARMAGIEPFCITVDREADDYLRRMYGDVRFLVVDRIADLPARLPRMYQQLTA